MIAVERAIETAPSARTEPPIPRHVAAALMLRGRKHHAVADVVARSALGCFFGGIAIFDAETIRPLSFDSLTLEEGVAVQMALAEDLASQMAEWLTLPEDARRIMEATGLPPSRCREIAERSA